MIFQEKSSYDVIIIGYGISGIALAAKCVEHGLNYLVLERNTSFGGVWFDTTDNTSLQTSREFYQFSDFPFPPDTPPYPDRNTIMIYLRRYIQFKGIRETSSVRFNYQVEKIERIPLNDPSDGSSDNTSSEWQINGNPNLCATYLGFCNGFFSHPKKIATTSTRNTYNSLYFNKLVKNTPAETFKNMFENKNVLIHGNGATACDIVERLKECPGINITVSIRKDKFYIRKFIFGISTAFFVNGYILNIVKYVHPSVMYILFTLFEMLFSVGNSTWVPKDKINYTNMVGKTTLNGKAKKNVKLAHFLGDWEHPLYDIQIWATGSTSTVYDLIEPHLNKPYNTNTQDNHNPILENYLFIYNPELERCGFIGFAPSYNWLQVSETQAKLFVENIVKGIYPEKKTMFDWIDKRKEYVKKIGIKFNDLTYDGNRYANYHLF